MGIDSVESEAYGGLREGAEAFLSLGIDALAQSKNGAYFIQFFVPLMEVELVSLPEDLCREMWGQACAREMGCIWEEDSRSDLGKISSAQGEFQGLCCALHGGVCVLVGFYTNGAGKKILKAFQQLATVRLVQLDCQRLRSLGQQVGHIQAFAWHFEESPLLFRRAQKCKGSYKGQAAQETLESLGTNLGHMFRLVALETSLHAEDDILISIGCDGLLTSVGKLDLLFDLLELQSQLIKKRYALYQNAVLSWQEEPAQTQNKGAKNRGFAYRGVPIYYEFSRSPDLLHRWLALFRPLMPKLGVLNIGNRLSRNWYQVQMLDSLSAVQLCLQISDVGCIACLEDEASIPLLWSVEHYLRRVFDPTFSVYLA